MDVKLKHVAAGKNIINHNQAQTNKYNTYCCFRPGFLVNQHPLPSSDNNIIIPATPHSMIVASFLTSTIISSPVYIKTAAAQSLAIKIAVEALASYGLTKQYLIRNINLPCVDAAQGLIYFVTGKHPEEDGLPVINYPIAPSHAIREMNDLCSMQRLALIKLYAYGLRGHHLRQFKSMVNETFSHQHQKLLVYLMRDKVLRLNPKDAMKKINGISEEEAQRILDALPEDEIYQTFDYGCSKNFGKILPILEKELSTYDDLRTIDLRFRHLDSMTSMQLTRLWKALSPLQQLQDVYLDYNEIHRMTDEQFKTLLDCDIFGAILHTLINSNDMAIKIFGSKLLSMKNFSIHSLFFRLNRADLLNCTTLIMKAIDIDNPIDINLLSDMVIHAQALNVDNGLDIDENLYDFYAIIFTRGKNGEFKYKDIISNFEFVFIRLLSRRETIQVIHSYGLIDNTYIEPSKNPYAVIKYSSSPYIKMAACGAHDKYPLQSNSRLLTFSYDNSEEKNFNRKVNHYKNKSPQKIEVGAVVIAPDLSPL